MKTLCTIALILAFAFSGNAAAQVTSLDLESLPAIERNTVPQTNIGLLLVRGDESTRQNLVRIVTATPQKFNPTVFYALSRALLELDRKDEAVFWYCAGKLRATYDANRSLDLSSKGGVSRLDASFAPPIWKLQLADKEKLRSTLQRVVEWDMATPSEYDHRWINLHGLELKIFEMNGRKGPPPRTTVPADQWPSILATTRAKFIDSYEDEITKVQELIKQRE